MDKFWKKVSYISTKNNSQTSHKRSNPLIYMKNKKRKIRYLSSLDHFPQIGRRLREALQQKSNKINGFALAQS